MLPYTLLPSGVLQSMRTTAQQFMTEPIALYHQTLSYDAYGSQSVTLSGIWSGYGYLGKISGKDEEIYYTYDRFKGGKEGIENVYPALLLLPIDTPITEFVIASGNGYFWRVVWTNQDTQDSVQVYARAIIERTVDRDGFAP